MKFVTEILSPWLLTQRFKSNDLNTFFHNLKMSFFFKEKVSACLACWVIILRAVMEQSSYFPHPYPYTRVTYSLLLSFSHGIYNITICQHKKLAYYIPRFTSGNILSRNWVSPPLGDRKSAKSWLLLNSGCCRSFFETEGKKEVQVL